MTTLTETRTEAVLRVVREYIALHGYAPSVRDIVRLANLSSTSVAYFHLRKLAEQGRIKGVGHNSARTITVVEGA